MSSRNRPSRSGSRKQAAKRKFEECFKCRKPGHRLANCPQLLIESENAKGDEEDANFTGACYHCGSLEHIAMNCFQKNKSFKYAKCFVCSKAGHISRNCPNNSRGIYPKGGCCSICQQRDHLKRNCPNRMASPKEPILATAREFKRCTDNPEDDDSFAQSHISKKKPRLLKIS
ncbi:Zinc finger CCHC domain-containing protein 9 [Cichlidogyrus casuarinus]|uniref:Zinc finger CCHC domain-containing protein 9 n=1 Tax=Cichlidogyrus casuarinus TaxID=1844966 RepID=A0ABD2PU59_9PLAT